MSRLEIHSIFFERGKQLRVLEKYLGRELPTELREAFLGFSFFWEWKDFFETLDKNLRNRLYDLDPGRNSNSSNRAEALKRRMNYRPSTKEEIDKLVDRFIEKVSKDILFEDKRGYSKASDKTFEKIHDQFIKIVADALGKNAKLSAFVAYPAILQYEGALDEIARSYDFSSSDALQKLERGELLCVFDGTSYFKSFSYGASLKEYGFVEEYRAPVYRDFNRQVWCPGAFGPYRDVIKEEHFSHYNLFCRLSEQ